MGGDQDRRPQQVGTGESTRPNQAVQEVDGKMTETVGETQVGIQVQVAGGVGMMVLPVGPGEQVAQGEEAVEEGWVL